MENCITFGLQKTLSVAGIKELIQVLGDSTLSQCYFKADVDSELLTVKVIRPFGKLSSRLSS